MRWSLLFLLFVILSFFACEERAVLYRGQIITESFAVQADTFRLPAFRQIGSPSAGFEEPMLTIRGNDLVIDFGGAVLVGTDTLNRPDQFEGVAILIDGGKNITLKNLTIRGFKIGIIAKQVDGLQLEACDLSYTFRESVMGKIYNKASADKSWNDWLQDGVGLALDKCSNSKLTKLNISNGSNGILLKDCTNNTIKHNIIQFNAGIGISLISSSNNEITDNNLDWNIPKADSSALNTIGAYWENSASHHNQITNNSVVNAGMADPNANMLSPTLQRFQDYVLWNEWGPYNFQYPSIWLRKKEATQYTFLLLGPLGNWKLVDGEGLIKVGPKSGTFPATLVAEQSPDASNIQLHFEFIGTSFEDQYGQSMPKGMVIPFSFSDALPLN